MTHIASLVFAWILPIVLGPLVYVLARQLLNAHYTIDGLPPTAKRVIVGIVGVLLATVFQQLGVTAPPECSDSALPEFLKACSAALSAAPVAQGVTASLVALVLHALKKSNPRD